MKILIAPNSFKECAGSVEIAEILRSELLRKKVYDVVMCPVSDGGDDFLDVYAYNFPVSKLNFTSLTCYDNNKLTFPSAFDPVSRQYVLESAKAIGLKIIPEEYRNPLKLNSENLGHILAEIERTGSSSGILIGLGGSGTTDLGLGLAVSFGLKLLNENGDELKVLPENYIKTKKIVLPRRSQLQIEAVLDVKVPLTGSGGCVHIFGGQKGASDEDGKIIDAGFANIIDILKRDYNLDYTSSDLGAAGGLSVGLSLISDFKITFARSFLNNRLGLDKKIQDSDVIITAEGKFDEQSLLNKASGLIVNDSLERHKKIIIITGECTVKFSNNKAPIVIELVKLMGSKDRAISEYKKALKLATDSLLKYIA